MKHGSDENPYSGKREPPNSPKRAGLTDRQHRVLDASLTVLLAVFVVGWIYSTALAIARGDPPTMARQIGATGSPFSSTSPPDANYALNAVLERFIDWDEVRGASGALRIVVRAPEDTLALPESLPSGVSVGYTPRDRVGADSARADAATATRTPDRPGIWSLIAHTRGTTRLIPDLSVVTLVPSTALRGGQIGEFRVGQWPRGEGEYAAPGGFIEVTPENLHTPVSDHFVLGDFLTKGQEGVWPKYVVLQPRLLDKLELTLQELEAMGHPVENVFVVSGFRTPWYNESGGDPRGRGAMSRHMYGDAADIAIDNDGDRCMDDLNRDGSVDIEDARIIVRAAERVESRHPGLVGGIGIYRPNPGAHCGMVHIDTRGYRARW